MNTYKEKQFTHAGCLYRRTDCYNAEGILFRVYFERLVPETSVARGLGKWSDRHAHWRLVNSVRNQNLYSKLLVSSDERTQELGRRATASLLAKENTK